ncbi:MAG: hypothetical protein D8B54_01680 [Catonella sp.]|nr:MAG: hypothetical protein D8B54_01680 [Catonella sp.]
MAYQLTYQERKDQTLTQEVSHLTNSQTHFDQLVMQLQEAYDYFDNLATLSAYIRHNQGAVVQFNHQRFLETVLETLSNTPANHYVDCYLMGGDAPVIGVYYVSDTNGDCQLCKTTIWAHRGYRHYHLEKEGDACPIN